MPADELEKIAVDVFGRDRVIKEANLPDAIQTAVNMVDAEDELGVGYGHGVLICGSFVTAGDARLMLEEHASPTMRQARPFISRRSTRTIRISRQTRPRMRPPTTSRIR